MSLSPQSLTFASYNVLCQTQLSQFFFQKIDAIKRRRTIASYDPLDSPQVPEMRGRLFPTCVHLSPWQCLYAQLPPSTALATPKVSRESSLASTRSSNGGTANAVASPGSSLNSPSLSTLPSPPSRAGRSSDAIFLEPSPTYNSVSSSGSEASRMAETLRQAGPLPMGFEESQSCKCKGRRKCQLCRGCTGVHCKCQSCWCEVRRSTPVHEKLRQEADLLCSFRLLTSGARPLLGTSLLQT